MPYIVLSPASGATVTMGCQRVQLQLPDRMRHSRCRCVMDADFMCKDIASTFSQITSECVTAVCVCNKRKSARHTSTLRRTLVETQLRQISEWHEYKNFK